MLVVTSSHDLSVIDMFIWNPKENMNNFIYSSTKMVGIWFELCYNRYQEVSQPTNYYLIITVLLNFWRKETKIIVK